MTVPAKHVGLLIGLTVLYFAVSLLGILHHELWLDESHHWLLSRDSISLLDLVKNTRYEGHPILWNVLLFGITRFTLNPFLMQLLHIVISTSAIAVFLWKAPFHLVFKTMFIFGYFMFFEYNVISRNYILGVLFLFLACSVFNERKNKFVLLCVYLGLAANTHSMFSVVAFAMFLTLLFEHLQEKSFSNRCLIIGCIIFISALIIMTLQVIPPDDTRFFNHVNEVPMGEKFIKGFISFFKGIITIPDFTSIHFWNSNLLVNLNKPVASVLGLLSYFIPLILFFRSIKTMFFVYIAIIGVQIFFYFTQLGATRYDGFNYIIITIGLWIYQYYKPDGYKLLPFLISLKLDFLRKPIIYGILLIQLFSGICAYTMDYKYQFCAAKETVSDLKMYHLDRGNIITVTCDGTLISPFLQKKVYFLCDGKLESYCHWDFGCAKNIIYGDIVSLISDYMKTHNTAVFVSYYPIGNKRSVNWETINAHFAIRFRERTGESIVRNTSLYIYEVKKIADK